MFWQQLCKNYKKIIKGNKFTQKIILTKIQHRRSINSTFYDKLSRFVAAARVPVTKDISNKPFLSDLRESTRWVIRLHNRFRFERDFRGFIASRRKLFRDVCERHENAMRTLSRRWLRLFSARKKFSRPRCRILGRKNNIVATKTVQENCLPAKLSSREDLRIRRIVKTCSLHLHDCLARGGFSSSRVHVASPSNWKPWHHATRKTSFKSVTTEATAECQLRRKFHRNVFQRKHFWLRMAFLEICYLGSSSPRLTAFQMCKANIDSDEFQNDFSVPPRVQSRSEDIPRVLNQ